MKTEHCVTYKHYDIFFTLYPPTRGSRDSLGGIRGAGPPLEPDDPAEIEITRIYDQLKNEDVDPCELSNIDELQQACYDHIQEQPQ